MHLNRNINRLKRKKILFTQEDVTAAKQVVSKNTVNATMQEQVVHVYVDVQIVKINK